MAASSRERQRKHRELQRQAGARIVDYVLPLETHEKIKKLALAGNKSKKAAIIELVNRAMLNASPPQTTPQENKQKLANFEQSPATKTGYSVTGRITLFQKLPTRLRY